LLHLPSGAVIFTPVKAGFVAQALTTRKRYRL
jgi:hypothetical protein